MDVETEVPLACCATFEAVGTAGASEEGDSKPAVVLGLPRRGAGPPRRAPCSRGSVGIEESTSQLCHGHRWGRNSVFSVPTR